MKKTMNHLENLANARLSLSPEDSATFTNLMLGILACDVSDAQWDHAIEFALQLLEDMKTHAR